MKGQRSEPFPEIESYETGFLQLDKIHTLYWEQCGNPQGVPIVVLHGGPGGGCFPKHRQYFDPEVYRIVLFDQRGAHRSTPVGETRNNTTPHLLEDIERLRAHLGIERWVVFGGSWGATLALAYGQAHPQRCLGFILRGVYLGLQEELDWFLGGVRQIFPERWQQFQEFIPKAERGDLLKAYHQRIHHPDPNVHLEAARQFNRYGCSLLSMQPDVAEIEEMISQDFSLPLARIETHYFLNKIFLPNNALIDNLPKVTHLPAILIHGRYDMTCPASSAVRLHQNWPGSELHMLPLAGHSGSDPGVLEAILLATESYIHIGEDKNTL